MGKSWGQLKLEAWASLLTNSILYDIIWEVKMNINNLKTIEK